MKYPVLVTKGTFTFPGHKNIIEVDNKKTLASIDAATTTNNKIIIVSQKNVFLDEATKEDQLFSVGTLAMMEIKDNYKKRGKIISVTGIKRVKIFNIIFNTFIYASIKKFRSISGDGVKEQVLVKQISSQIEKSVSGLIKMPKYVLDELSNGISASELADIFGHYMPMSVEKKWLIFSAQNINERLKSALKILKEESLIIKIEKNIDANVRETLDKQQKDFLLRERLKIIKEELGEISSKDSDIDEIRKKINDDKYPDYVKKQITEELKKYESMPAISAEANVSKSYIDWLVKLPWKTYSKDSTNIDNAKIILDKDHFGLLKVKERIIEHLAVKANTNSYTSPIITLIGPPGVGKTSLAKSIAKAIGREFIKVSLGGVRDEAEIRGHRRTYVGSMPGKIIQALNKAKTSNPIILLDEIDKMSSDYKGDPTSAMLEVLDPEQNNQFQDHYLEVDYDLSKVMFFATANYYEDMPCPLLDRVELIKLSAYTTSEKMNIAKKHLIPELLKQNGLTKTKFQITDNMIKYLIDHYTLEAGVRGLKRILDKLARKIVVLKLKGKLKSCLKLTEDTIFRLLGPKKIELDQKEEKNKITGQVTGLAYTQYGGSTLPVEVTTFSGKGELKITGQLKDVMNESANIALAFVKANTNKFCIDFDFAKNDIHIHVPEGAIPKDGPSAGVTFTTALISALSKRGVSPNFAMTGEITLRGKVLQIGGLKEKSLAAVRMGIKEIFIPMKNKKDLIDLPKETLDNLIIHAVSDYSEIYNKLF